MSVCVLQAGVALPQHGALPYFMYNSDLLAGQPPPAHMRLAPLQFAAHPGLSVSLSHDRPSPGMILSLSVTEWGTAMIAVQCK